MYGSDLVKLYSWISSGVYKFRTDEYSDPTGDYAVLLVNLEKEIRKIPQKGFF